MSLKWNGFMFAMVRYGNSQIIQTSYINNCSSCLLFNVMFGPRPCLFGTCEWVNASQIDSVVDGSVDGHPHKPGI